MNPDSSCGEQGVPGTLSCLHCDSLSTENVLGKPVSGQLGVLYLALLKLNYLEISLEKKNPKYKLHHSLAVHFVDRLA